MHYPVDFIEFVERRLPLSDESGLERVPAHLPRHDQAVRPGVVAVGHSIGGSAV